MPCHLAVGLKNRKNIMIPMYAGSPTASRSPLPEGASYLAPRKSVAR